MFSSIIISTESIALIIFEMIAKSNILIIALDFCWSQNSKVCFIFQVYSSFGITFLHKYIFDRFH